MKFIKLLGIMLIGSVLGVFPVVFILTLSEGKGITYSFFSSLLMLPQFIILPTTFGMPWLIGAAISVYYFYKPKKID